jgi:uncharacterized membrane protein YeaQ/YmgE (transglycosylase-associated protein family)
VKVRRPSSWSEVIMTNYLIAVVIGIVIGGVGAVVLRRQAPSAVWLAPVLAVVGALLAAVLGATLGHADTYGWKKAALQIVLALVGVVVAAMVGRRGASSSPASGAVSGR